MSTLLTQILSLFVFYKRGPPPKKFPKRFWKSQLVRREFYCIHVVQNTYIVCIPFASWTVLISWIHLLVSNISTVLSAIQLESAPPTTYIFSSSTPTPGTNLLVLIDGLGDHPDSKSTREIASIEFCWPQPPTKKRHFLSNGAMHIDRRNANNHLVRVLHVRTCALCKIVHRREFLILIETYKVLYWIG